MFHASCIAESFWKKLNGNNDERVVCSLLILVVIRILFSFSLLRITLIVSLKYKSYYVKKSPISNFPPKTNFGIIECTLNVIDCFFLPPLK